MIDSTGMAAYENEYVEGVLVRQRSFDSAGNLLIDQFHFPGREEHRALYYGNLATEGFIIETTWDANHRVREECRTPAGVVLDSHAGIITGGSPWLDHTGRISGGVLVLSEWNGEPIADKMNRLLAQLPKVEERLAWKLPLDTQSSTKHFMGDETYHVSIDPAASRVPFCSGRRSTHQAGIFGGVVARQRDRDLYTPSAPRQPVSYELLDLAHSWNRTLRVRFGILTLVPINADLPNEQDPTGALAVEFAAGSIQEKAWLKPVIHMQQDVEPHAKRIEKFFAGTGIEVDASRVKLFDQTLPKASDATCLRPRRDVLGTFLLVSNYRIEQHGAQLVLYPR